MSKIGLTVSRNSLDAPLALHFGKAKWILMYENAETFQFVRNEKLIGRDVVEAYRRAGCRDVVLNNIGRGALRNLRASGIRVWYGPPNVPFQELIKKLKRGELKEATQDSELGCHQQAQTARTEGSAPSH